MDDDDTSRRPWSNVAQHTRAIVSFLYKSVRACRDHNAVHRNRAVQEYVITHTCYDGLTGVMTHEMTRTCYDSLKDALTDTCCDTIKGAPAFIF